MPELKMVDINAAIELLAAGGILVYRTETLWAIGCAIASHEAVGAIFKIKGRPWNKPVPIIAASIRQAAKFADLQAVPEKLSSAFWPGPLTIVVPAIVPLPSGIVNKAGKMAVRVTGDADIAGLAEAAGSPLVATSANISGKAAPTLEKELDREFLARCSAQPLPCAILGGDEAPGSVLPSTIVEPCQVSGRWRLRILRQGAVTLAQLKGNEWELL